MKARVTNVQTAVDPQNGNFLWQEVQFALLSEQTEPDLASEGKSKKVLVHNGNLAVLTIKNEADALTFRSGEVVDFAVK